MGAVDADVLARHGVEAETAEIAIEKLSDPFWRITSGELYKILIKGDVEDGSNDLVLAFKPNRAQIRFMKRLWHRNIILKARQLGFTTLICILWLDHALFNENSRCGIVAQNRESAEVIFRDKVRFAYDNLPDGIRNNMPLIKETESELIFKNNSSIRVGVSMRSGTYHRMLVSEFGKICAESPKKANEVVTGTIPTVPKSGVLVIESTAEGTEGDFYKMCQLALAKQKLKAKLTVRDYRMHFYAWHMNPQYVMDTEGVILTQKDHEYFARIEAAIGYELTPEQKAWYVATRDADFSGDEEKMWQEYPSTPDEAFQKSTAGNYYAQQMAVVRKHGRILNIPVLDLPVYTFWDIGRSDGTAIWFFQFVGMEARVILYKEEHGETLRYWAKELQDTGFIYATHFLPHDAEHKRLSENNKSTKEMLEGLLPGQSFEIVPRIDNLQDGIQMVRQELGSVWFDETGCKLGISRLDNYKKAWNSQQGRFHDYPLKDINTEGADAFRQYAQAKAGGLIRLTVSKPSKRRKGSWRTA